MELSDDDRQGLAEHGLVHLSGLVPKRRVAAARDAVLAELARLGARVDGKWHEARVPKQLRHLPALDEVIPADVQARASEVAEVALVPAQVHPQLLLTPPQKVRWAVPSLGWHLDVASPSRDAIPGLQIFVLLDDLAPDGGATVAIAGSHRLHSPRGGGARSALQTLQTDPIYAGLFARDARATGERQRFLQPMVVRDVTVQVKPMSGKAGDAWLMDMRVVHAASPNASRGARMVLTSRFVRPS